jgi:hypothetical protein
MFDASIQGVIRDPEKTFEVRPLCRSLELPEISRSLILVSERRRRACRRNSYSGGQSAAARLRDLRSAADCRRFSTHRRPDARQRHLKFGSTGSDKQANAAPTGIDAGPRGPEGATCGSRQGER